MLDTILIVDSDESNGKAMQQSISGKLRYDVLLATNGHDAMKVVLHSDTAPSLMLLGMNMPRIDSLYLIRCIKLQRPDFPIIILVEYGDHARAVDAIEAGANDFLTKPVTIERLGLSISSALRICHLCNLVKKLELQLDKEVVNEVIGNQNSRYIPPYLFSNSSVLGKDVKIKNLRALEEDAICFALDACGGSMSKAARSLGIGRSTLYRKVNELRRNKRKDSYKENYILRENQTTRPIMVTSEIEHS